GDDQVGAAGHGGRADGAGRGRGQDRSPRSAGALAAVRVRLDDGGQPHLDRDPAAEARGRRRHRPRGLGLSGRGRIGDAMDFGIFLEEMRRGISQVAAFHEGFQLVDAAEAWGVDGVWLGEMHFNPARSVLSASIAMASSIATRTRRLRVGTAVQLLPLNHPLRIAEEVATVDHISEGRFDFGIGRSGVVRTYDIYGVPYGESQARFREALEIIRQGWKGEPFSYEGEFY